MIALAISLAYLATLAFGAFALWLLHGRHLLADLRGAEDRLKALVAAGLAESKAEADAVRRDMDALAAATNLTRAGSPFTQRGPSPASSVLR